MQFTESFEKSKAQIVALNTKAVEMAEDTTKAVFAYTREVLSAKTPEAFWAVQQSFMKSQQDAVAKQAEAMKALYADWLKETSAPMADALKPFFGKAA